MSKICKNCGRELKDTANYCGRCGMKLTEDHVQTDENASNNKSDLNDAVMELIRNTIAQQQIENEPLKPKNELFNKENKATAKQYINTVKNKGKGIADDVKNYKSLSLRKKRNIIIICIVILIVIIGLAFLLIHSGGASDKVVSEAALSIAEQDYGYKLEMNDYEIAEQFTANTEIPLTGEKIKADVYFVILDADVKDTNGDLAATVKYLVCCVDPEMKDGVATYNVLSTATNCTGMDDDYIKDRIQTISASLR